MVPGHGQQSWSGSLFYYDPGRYSFDIRYLVHSEKCQEYLEMSAVNSSFIQT